MNIKFLLNEIKMDQVIKRLDSQKLRDLIWNYYENSSLIDRKNFKQQIDLLSLKKDTSNIVKGFIYSDECFNFLIDIFKNEGDIEEKNRPICLNWYISKILIPALKQKEPTSITGLLGLSSYTCQNYLNKLEKFFQYQRFIEPPEKKDLMNINDDFELNSLIFSARTKYIAWVEKNKYKQLKDKAEYRKIHEDDEFSIYIPDNKEASCLLGMGTKWCTASLTSRNYYKDYHSKENPLFILISKNDPKKKYQFHFDTEQFMNADDSPIYHDLFYNLLEDYYKIFSKYQTKIIYYLFQVYQNYEPFIIKYIDDYYQRAPEFGKINYKKCAWWTHYGEEHYYLPLWLYKLVPEQMLQDRKERREKYDESWDKNEEW